MQQLNKQEKETARIMDKDTLTEHYRSESYGQSKKNLENKNKHDLKTTESDQNENHYTGDNITLDELNEAPQQMKNRKAATSDLINNELIKYEGLLLELRILHLLNESLKKNTG